MQLMFSISFIMKIGTFVLLILPMIILDFIWLGVILFGYHSCILYNLIIYSGIQSTYQPLSLLLFSLSDTLDISFSVRLIIKRILFVLLMVNVWFGENQPK